MSVLLRFGGNYHHISRARFPWKEMEVLPVQCGMLCALDFDDSIPGHGEITERMDCEVTLMELVSSLITSL
ncbi:hypothetical protein DY000_02037288 [Brassica cretica]|uniref:Uncharacterized protein n=1 Tax=Brassica cretica TaxID=69181 RepID=A0ABQ7BEK5_BRACR|nr:hypothetical protein DY000_02037288 [Brassica cretica]